jgi:hypothetical protein
MKKGISFIALIFICFSFTSFNTAVAPVKIALLKYGGGGDWYANPTSLTNLIRFVNKEMNMGVDQSYATVEVGSADIFNFPFIHMTGHGNVVFTELEAQNLRLYLLSGGFLHIDDNFGMDPFVRPSMKRVFPELDFIELPFTHEIYHQKYDFAHGLPKIHKHEDKAPQGFGLIWQGRLVCFYSYECDLGDGWEDREVHKDTEEARINALRMGANLLRYVFQQ